MPSDPYENLPPRLAGWILGNALPDVPEKLREMVQNVQCAQTLEALALSNSNQQGPDGSFLVADEVLVLAGVLWTEVAKAASTFGAPAIESWAENQATECVDRGRMYANSKAHARKMMGQERES